MILSYHLINNCRIGTPTSFILPAKTKVIGPRSHGHMEGHHRWVSLTSQPSALAIRVPEPEKHKWEAITQAQRQDPAAVLLRR